MSRILFAITSPSSTENKPFTSQTSMSRGYHTGNRPPLTHASCRAKLPATKTWVASMNRSGRRRITSQSQAMRNSFAEPAAPKASQHTAPHGTRGPSRNLRRAPSRHGCQSEVSVATACSKCDGPGVHPPLKLLLQPSLHPKGLHAGNETRNNARSTPTARSYKTASQLIQS